MLRCYQRSLRFPMRRLCACDGRPVRCDNKWMIGLQIIVNERVMDHMSVFGRGYRENLMGPAVEEQACFARFERWEVKSLGAASHGVTFFESSEPRQNRSEVPRCQSEPLDRVDSLEMGLGIL